MRRIWMLAAAAAMALPLAGCGGYGHHLTAGLHAQEAVAIFAPTATQREKLAARAACAHAGGARPEPLPPPGSKLSQQVYDVRFRIDDASDKQVAALETCLSGRPGVLGVSVTDPGDGM